MTITGRLIRARRPMRMSPRLHATSNSSRAPANTSTDAMVRNAVSIQCLKSTLRSRNRKFTSA